MKQIQWKNDNKMLFESGHREFDRQTNIISTGNIVANTLVGWYIRPYSETVGPMGQECRLGELQNYDLKIIRNIPYHIIQQTKAHLVDRTGILYKLFHTGKKYAVVHGYVLTGDNHVLIQDWITGPTHKSWNVVKEAEKYLTRQPNEEGEKLVRELHANTKKTWKLACQFDHVNEADRFVVFSEGNHFGMINDAAWKTYSDAYDKLKFDQPIEECKHPPTRLYSWTAYDGELVMCCCECGKVLKGAAEL